MKGRGRYGIDWGRSFTAMQAWPRLRQARKEFVGVSHVRPIWWDVVLAWLSLWMQTLSERVQALRGSSLQPGGSRVAGRRRLSADCIPGPWVAWPSLKGDPGQHISVPIRTELDSTNTNIYWKLTMCQTLCPAILYTLSHSSLPATFWGKCYYVICKFTNVWASFFIAMKIIAKPPFKWASQGVWGIY